MPDKVNYRPRSLQELEYLSTLASRRYLEGRSDSVLDSINTILKEEDGLTKEHIKRVVEFTNTNVLRGLLDTERNKTIGFQLANAEEIITAYGVPPTGDNKSDSLSEYSRPVNEVLSIESPLTPKGEVPASKFISSTESPPIEQKAAHLIKTCSVAAEWIGGELQNQSLLKGLEEESIRGMIKELLFDPNSMLSGLDKLADACPLSLKYLKEVLLDMNKTGELVLLHNTKTAESAEDYDLPPDHPLVTALNNVTLAEQKIEALIGALNQITKKREEALSLLDSL